MKKKRKRVWTAWAVIRDGDTAKPFDVYFQHPEARRWAIALSGTNVIKVKIQECES